MFSIHWYSPGYIRSGCIVQTNEWWLENVIKCAEEHDYDEQQQAEYLLYVKQIIEWGDLLMKHGKLSKEIKS